MVKPLAKLLICLFVMAVPPDWALLAADHTNFSGTWNLDLTRSDFGPFPAPTRLTDQIVQSNYELVINRDRDGDKVAIHVPLDGGERTNRIRLGLARTRAHWEGAVLVIDYSGQQGGRTVKSEERWILSPKKTTIKVTRHLTAAKGETQQTLTMVKAGSGH
jgi:hypothetical protein